MSAPEASDVADFDGFPAEAFEWFAGLERDNSRAYFERTRTAFETEIRGALVAMLAELQRTFGGAPRLFRQHRDLRFARGAPPYKTRTYAILQDAPDAAGGLYVELSARGLYAGSGLHGLARDQLERFRAAIDDDLTGPQLERAVAAAEEARLEVAGEALRTAPRGFPRDHPRIALLRRRALVAGARARPGPDGLSRDAALGHVAGTWRAAAPLAAWLTANVGPATTRA